jgi:hypothetical protein
MVNMLNAAHFLPKSHSQPKRTTSTKLTAHIQFQFYRYGGLNGGLSKDRANADVEHGFD